MRCHLFLLLLACQSTAAALQEQSLQTQQAAEWWESALDPKVMAARAENGRTAEHNEQAIDAVFEGDQPAYFKTYADTTAQLHDLAAAYPDLTQLIDLGPSGESSRGGIDRRVWLLRLTDKRVAGPKTKLLILAGEHAREIANPAMVLRWAEAQLAGAGSDAIATHVFASMQIDIVPMVNPDGHAVVERGLAGEPDGDVWQRKSTTPPSGTDINRNYPFHWGGIGASSSPGSETYRGAQAADEPEVRAVMALGEAERYPLALIFHSYSRLNLWSWGDTNAPTPDDAALKAIGYAFTRHNGYSPMQSIDLYPTTGTSDDSLYGPFGTFAFTIETGDDFIQDDDAYEETCRLNSPVIDYATGLAADPHGLALGPEVTVAASANQIVTASATDGASPIAAAELVRDLTVPVGQGTALGAADGAFNSKTEQVTGAALDGLFYVRAKNASGHWGPLRPVISPL